MKQKPSNVFGIRVYQAKKDSRFWYSILGVLLLLTIAIWLCGCATAPTYETVFYRTMDAYNQVADQAFVFAARPETTVEQKRTIVRILWVGEDVIDAADAGEKTVREAISVLTDCMAKLQEVIR